MRRARFVVLVLSLVLSCGDDDPVPIDDIPEDAKLAELSGAEFDGVCAWGKGVSAEKLPAGTNCNGVPIGFSGCMRVPSSCPVTVGEWKRCVPALLDRIADDPCELLDSASSPSRAMSYIAGAPGCAGVAACATVSM